MQKDEVASKEKEVTKLGGIPDYNHVFEQAEDKKGKKKSKFFRKVLAMNSKPLIASGFIYLIQAAPTWIIPLLTANVIDIVTLAINTGVTTSQTWWEIGINAGIIAILLIQNVPTTMWRWRVVSKMNRRITAGIRSSVVRKLQSLSMTYHKDILTGKIQSKFIADTENTDALFSGISHNLIPNVISVVVAFGICVVKNGWVSLFFLLVIPANVFLAHVFRNKLRRSYRSYRIGKENVSAKITNMLEMMPVTKSHGLESVEINSLNKSIEELAVSGVKVDKTVGHFGAWAWVVNQILSATCLFFCVALALMRMISVGDIVLYQSMFSQISSHVSALVNLMPQIGSGTESLNSIAEIINAKDVEVVIGKSKVPSIKGAVEFKNACYSYPDSQEKVINDFSLNVRQGECIAVVGSSGSGKTTLMNLLIGFMLPNSGDILIDGKSIKEVNLSEYRHHISVVPQTSILFPGTIRENITYGLSHYTEEQLDKVVEMANLRELIAELPDGLDTNIGEHGNKLSGGQKQRITIARALIRNPKILILDEATSALDNISEFQVQKAISASIVGRTTFIVAHRLSTIRNADRIVVLENGKIAECGSYDELMQKKGVFF